MPGLSPYPEDLIFNRFLIGCIHWNTYNLLFLVKGGEWYINMIKIHLNCYSIIVQAANHNLFIILYISFHTLRQIKKKIFLLEVTLVPSISLNGEGHSVVKCANNS